MQAEVKRAQAGDIPVIEAILRDHGPSGWTAAGSISGVRRMFPWKSLSRLSKSRNFILCIEWGAGGLARRCRITTLSIGRG